MGTTPAPTDEEIVSVSETISTRAFITEIHRLRKEITILHSKRSKTGESFIDFIGKLRSENRELGEAHKSLALENDSLKRVLSQSTIRACAMDARLDRAVQKVQELTRDNTLLRLRNFLLEQTCKMLNAILLLLGVQTQPLTNFVDEN